MSVNIFKMSDSGEPQCKKRKIEEEISVPNSSFNTSLLDLSDDVLLLILQLVTPPDLLTLSMCCQRLYNICCDKSLWEVVDFRTHNLKLSILNKFTRYLQTSTKFLATKGPVGAGRQIFELPTFSRCFLLSVAKSAPNLKTLIIENHVIDSSMLLLEDFPSTLEQLRIHNCDMRNLPTAKSYFYKLEKILPKLKKLDLSNNRWFNPHSLLALSKSPTLENLTLAGCNVSDCLPYASLAANFGFSALKVLDLRKTRVGDVEVTCFNRTSSLRHLYLCAAAASPQAETQVSDYSITTFGSSSRNHNIYPRHPNLGGLLILEVDAVPRPVCKLETLVVANYPGITDTTLKHVAASLKDLKYLDVTGTGCSEAGINDFKKSRPDVKIIPDVIA